MAISYEGFKKRRQKRLKEEREKQLEIEQELINSGKIDRLEKAIDDIIVECSKTTEKRRLLGGKKIRIKGNTRKRGGSVLNNQLIKTLFSFIKLGTINLLLDRFREKGWTINCKIKNICTESDWCLDGVYTKFPVLYFSRTIKIKRGATQPKSLPVHKPQSEVEQLKQELAAAKQEIRELREQLQATTEPPYSRGMQIAQESQ